MSIQNKVIVVDGEIKFYKSGGCVEVWSKVV